MKIDLNPSFKKIKSLIDDNPIAKKTFRYYNSRNGSCLSNHIYTCIYYDNDQQIGYGHLDYEDKLWLGMFVSDSYVGKGIGKKILMNLISIADDDIYLSVDIKNIPAINLYLGNGFRIFKTDDKIFYCVRKKNG